jgi:hypothetical protein
VAIGHHDKQTSLILIISTILLKSLLIVSHCFGDIVFNKVFIDLGGISTVTQLLLGLANTLLILLQNSIFVDFRLFLFLFLLFFLLLTLLTFLLGI